MVAIYLWPVYHHVIVFRKTIPCRCPGPYWVQVNHHFFFVLYSFVAMGIVTVFEWDLFFPDLLDIFVLGTLPLAGHRVFLARVGAIAVLIFGFLFDANFLAPVVLPAATDPPHLARFVAGHIVAVAGSGLFAAAFILALQGVLLSILGERLFRRISLALQGLAVTVLVVLFLLFPVLSGVTPGLLQADGAAARWFPPFWFLGMYQRLLEGPSVLPVFAELAKIGWVATLAVGAAALAFYPLAYLRRVRQLVEGASTRSTRNRMAAPLYGLLHATLVRPPIRRAIFHFIGQTLLRVPRYRIYLVLYGGVGLSVVVATVLRFTIQRGTSARGSLGRWNPRGNRDCGVLGDCRIADGVCFVGQSARELGLADCSRKAAALRSCDGAAAGRQSVGHVMRSRGNDGCDWRISAGGAGGTAGPVRNRCAVAGCSRDVRTADRCFLRKRDDCAFHRRAGKRATKPGIHHAAILYVFPGGDGAFDRFRILDRKQRRTFRYRRNIDRCRASVVSQEASGRGAAR